MAGGGDIVGVPKVIPADEGSMVIRLRPCVNIEYPPPPLLLASGLWAPTYLRAAAAAVRHRGPSWRAMCVTWIPVGRLVQYHPTGHIMGHVMGHPVEQPRGCLTSSGTTMGHPVERSMGHPMVYPKGLSMGHRKHFLWDVP